MSALPSRLDLEHGDDERRITAMGVIDSHTAERLLVELRQLGTSGDVVIDVSDIDFIDSSGLRSIILTHQELAEAGKALVLANPSAAVSRLLEITGLDGHLHTS